MEKLFRTDHSSDTRAVDTVALKDQSHSWVKGQRDVLVVATGGEGDLRQGEVVLSAGQRGVEHQEVALEHTGRKGL